MAKYGLLCLLTLFVIYQIEAKSSIIGKKSNLFSKDLYQK